MKTDDIMKLVEAYRCAGGSNEHYARQDHLRTAIEALVADAQRYRWLRVCENDSVVIYGDTGHCELMMESELDAAIDAAMEKKQ